MNTNVDYLKNIIEEIHNKLDGKNYIFLAKVTEHSWTCSLYDIENDTIVPANVTIEMFESFSEGAKFIKQVNGVLILFQGEASNLVSKLIPYYNPELSTQELYELMIYQEFGLSPKNPERQEVLKESILKEKIKTKLVYACLENNTPRIVECLKKIKKSELDQSFKYGGTPLGYCAKNNNVTCFKLIAEAGANVGKITLQYSQYTPLSIAFEKSSEIVKYIYSNYPDVFNKEVKKHGFKIATATRDINLLNLVFESGIEINSNDLYFPNLHCFADSNNIVGLEFILDKGADINLKDKNKRTALDKAKMRNNKEATDFLRSRGALE